MTTLGRLPYRSIDLKKTMEKKSRTFVDSFLFQLEPLFHRPIMRRHAYVIPALRHFLFSEEVESEFSGE